MTPEAMNIATAEHLGWTKIELYKDNAGPSFWCGIPPLQVGVGKDGEWEAVRAKHSKGIPNYSGDLNAMHEVEKVLSEKELARYAQFIIGMTRHALGLPGHESHYPIPFVIRATAAQRAEAFLRTVGKWKEGWA